MLQADVVKFLRDIGWLLPSLASLLWLGALEQGGRFSCGVALQKALVLAILPCRNVRRHLVEINLEQNIVQWRRCPNGKLDIGVWGRLRHWMEGKEQEIEIS